MQYMLARYDDAIATLRASLETPDIDVVHARGLPVLPPPLGSLVWLSFALAEAGRIDEALSAADRAVASVEIPTPPYQRHHAYWARAAVHLECGVADAAAVWVARMHDTAREADMALLSDNVAGLDGHAHALAGDVVGAIALLEGALTSPTRDTFSGQRDVLYLGDAYCRAGRLDEALAVAESARSFARRYGLACREAHAALLTARIHAEIGGTAQAVALNTEALDLAIGHGMRTVEANCHAAFAMLGDSVTGGRSANAHARLAIALFRDMDMPLRGRALEMAVSK
jgi:tetratricopeptide (TPR) repeat protein